MATKIIVNCETGEVSEVKLSAEEIKEREAAAKAYAAEKAQREAEEAAKAAAKQAAQEKLKALGLTDLEVAALSGI